MKIRLGRRTPLDPKPTRRPDDDQRPARGKEPAKAAKGAQPSSVRRAERDESRGRLVVGCMTGTSLDGIDVALVRLFGQGTAMRAEFVAGASRELGALAPGLRRLAEQQPMAAGEIARLARDFSLLHLDAVRDLGAHRIDLVSVHGQTVFHAPPVSWQLFQPAPLAHGLGVPVVCDLRAADLACGGQGAPITPIADHVLFRHGSERRAVVNLGGFCNVTVLPGGHDATRVAGGDVCACNQLLDGVARRALGTDYDRDGARAMGGTAVPKAVTALATMLELQAKSGRSLGTGDELGAWLDRHGANLPPEDLARSACAAIARTISRAIASRWDGVQRLVLAGGGTHNRALVDELTGRAGVPVVTSDRLGVPSSMREAAAMAVLGALCQDRVAITIPGITGVERAPIAGSWTLP